MDDIFDRLNPEQAEAVRHEKGPLLILAGAGSGKTRVLTHRIAYLISECGVNPWNILALTFTNKAAGEMRERIDAIVEFGAESIWVSTFHSTCVRILRRYIDTIGYDRSFSIYDTDDQKTVMKEILKQKNIDPKKTSERSFLSKISKAKENMTSAEKYTQFAGTSYEARQTAEVYTAYEERMRKNNALDFDDLLMKTVELFEQNPDALAYYRKRFHYICVDEYQDTNNVQFRLLALLACHTNEMGEVEHNLCVVGDDDQSIYRFRGANIYNILNFEEEYPGCKVIRLEQNYRSKGNILDAANEVIRNNTERKSKSLWTEKDKGGPIIYTEYANNFEEAEGIVEDISHLVNENGYDYKDMAVLYRTNAQSRALEEKCVTAGIPYKVVGGVNFYQRREIKDILAYLKVIDNQADDLSVRRIINVPKRGIGAATLDKIQAFADANELTLQEALGRTKYIQGASRAASKIESFLAYITGLRVKFQLPGAKLSQITDEILEETGYIDELKADGTDEAVARMENLDEFKTKILVYEQTHAGETGDGLAQLSAFLQEVSLVADIDNMQADKDAVLLMTLHGAKGLEFPVVFMAGMEEGLFPSAMIQYADDEEKELEEERRLCYVGITRAKERLYMSSCMVRMVRGQQMMPEHSRFIDEIPPFLLKRRGSLRGRSYGYGSAIYGANRDRTSYGTSPDAWFSDDKSSSWGKKSEKKSGDKYGGKTGLDLLLNNPGIKKGMGGMSGAKPAKKSVPTGPRSDPDSFSVGDRVKHVKFGEGVITASEGEGMDKKITIDFDGKQRRMKAAVAPLTKLD